MLITQTRLNQLSSDNVKFSYEKLRVRKYFVFVSFIIVSHSKHVTAIVQQVQTPEMAIIKHRSLLFKPANHSKSIISIIMANTASDFITARQNYGVNTFKKE